MDKETLQVNSKELIDVLQKLLKKGNATRIVVKKQSQVICNLPVTAIAVAALWAPLLAGLSLGVVFAGNYQVLVDTKLMGGVMAYACPA